MPDTAPQAAQDTRHLTPHKATWAFGLALILGLVWVIWAQPFTAKPAQVTVEVVKAAPAQRVLAVNGQVAAVSSVLVRASVSGSLAGQMAEEGQKVSVGDILAQLDATQQQAVVRQAQSALAQGILVQAQAASDYARLRDLGSTTARVKIEDAARALARAAQSVESLRAVLEQAQIQLARYTVRAPIAGVIMQRNADPGQFIEPALSIFTLSDLSSLRIETNLDEAYATQIATGQTAVLQLVGTTGTEDGTVSFVSPRVDPATGGLQIKITPDAPLQAPVGLTVTANIIVEDSPLALTIPRTAMVAGPAVFLLAAGHAVKTPVAVIDWPAARLIVTKGLSEGDSLIANAANLQDGQAVTVGP